MTHEQRHDLVAYRMENAAATIDEVKEHCAHGYWNTAVNRMYYACFYAATALLLANEIETRSHEGVRQKLGQHFIKTDVLPRKYGRFYTQLFGKRSQGDYEDYFDNTQEGTEAMYPMAIEFIQRIRDILMADGWLP